MNVNQLVHLTGVGTYRMHSIKYAEDPAPFVGKDRKSNLSARSKHASPDKDITLYTADPSKQEPLDQFATVDPLAGEQTIFSDAELEEAGFTKNQNLFSPFVNGTAMNIYFVSLVPAGSDNTMAESTMALIPTNFQVSATKGLVRWCYEQ